MSSKRSRVRQWISVLLIVGMLVTALPTVAYADTEGAATPAPTTPTTVTTASASPDTPETTTVTNTKSFDAVQSAIVRKGQFSGTVQGLSNGSVVLKNCGDNNNYTREGYIQFDTSDGAINTDKITQVKLVLYAFQQKAVNPANIKLKVTAVNDEGWVADKITAADAANYAAEELATTQALATQYTEYVFDVTNYVKGKRSSQSGYGKASFLLRSAATDSYAEIYVASQQISDQQYAPKLIVTYDVDISASEFNGDGNTDDLIPGLQTYSRLSLNGNTEVSFSDIEEEWNADQKDKLLRQANMKGSGTVSDPYLIYTAEDLMSMTENDNKCYKLMSDIDLKGKKWRPVGLYYWYPFMGYLDGNGHKITNLYVGGNGEDAWDISAAGLFGYFEGRVENLGVETYVAKREGIDFAGYAGGIAGIAIAPAEIVNCYFNGRVAGAYSIGGLVGISYPGTIIENCCALGSVDMSQLFDYRYDNFSVVGKQAFDNFMKYLIWGGETISGFIENFVTTGPLTAIMNLFSDAAKFPSVMKEAQSLAIFTAERKTNMGGLVGLNYGTIRNSYAANRLYGDASKVGAIAARNICISTSDGAKVENCYYDQNITRDNEGDKIGYTATTKDGLRQNNNNVLNFVDSNSLTGKKEVQWDFSAKTLANKSTGGYPLPKTHRIKRSKRNATITKGGNTTTIEVEPEVYYNSRVLMRTRESYFLSSRTTAAGSLVCSECRKLMDNKDHFSNHIAVTGQYQRGSISKPYHVHDLESLIAMQDYKESHFILCDDIDFLVSDGEHTVQKYWWPAGKTHFSPVKGSLKGNLSVKKNLIGGTIQAKKINSVEKRFTIKHLTVQHNRHAAMFASFRGTVSDINFEISSGEWKSWRDGIRNSNNMISGISTVGDTASGAVIAGDTVSGALIRDCRVGGDGSAKNLSVGPNGEKIGRVDGSLRAGGIVGMLNRGTKIDNCEVAIITSTKNFDKHLDEDAFMKELEYASAIADMTVPLYDLAAFAFSLCGKKSKNKTNNEISNAAKVTPTNSKRQKQNWAKWAYRFLNEVVNPLWSFYYGRYGNVCTGSLVGDAYGAASKCIIYVTTKDPAFWFNDGDVFGRANFMSEDPNNIIMATADDGQSGAEVQNVSENPSADVFGTDICDCSVSLETYLFRNNIKVSSLESMKYGIRGLGTDEEPILVSNEDDLKRIAELMAEGYTFENAYILQTDNIELTEDFECMGLSSRTSFKGIYDGNDCKITGLNIEDEEGAALFYKLDGGVVRDLKIDNGSFTAPVAAAFAIYAEDLSILYNCGSNSVVTSTATEQQMDSSRAAAGLVCVLEDSFIANSFAAKSVFGMRAAGLVGWIKGVSQMVKCYSAVDFDDSVITAGIAFSIEGESWWEQCYWKKTAETGTTTAFRYVDEGVFEGLSADWADYASTYGLNYTSTSDIARADERCEFALAKTEKTDEYLKSQSFIGSLTNDPLSDFVIIDMSEKIKWELGFGLSDFDYPGHYIQNAKIRLVKPEYGSLTLEYRDFHDRTYTWQEVEFNDYGYAEVERGDYIRVTLNDLPVDKDVDCWTINGVPQSDKTGNTITVMANQNAIFAVRIKEGTPVQDQTRPLFISETLNGVASIEVTDVYAEPGDEPWPSMEFTNPISGEPVFTIGSQNCSVAGDDNSLKSYLGVDYKKLTDQTGKIIYRIEIPYNAIVKVTFTPKNGYHLADYYQNGEKHTVESSSAYVVGPFRMTDSIGLSFFGKAN